MKTRTLGSIGPRVSALGLGAMGMSGLYGPTDEGESIATIHAALDAGITLIDTGDFYGMGHNELLISRALEGPNRATCAISVKFGALRGPGGSVAWLRRPSGRGQELPRLHAAAAADRPRRHLPPRARSTQVPIEETIGAIGELVQAGYVRYIGLSEVGAETIRRAAAVHPISDLQIEYSLISRGHRGRDPAHVPRARHRHHRLRRPLPRAASAATVAAERELSAAATSARHARASRREPRAQPPAGRGAARARRRAGCERRPDRDRVGARAGEDIVPLVGARGATGCARRSGRSSWS